MGFAGLVFRSHRYWLGRLFVSQLRCRLSLHGLIQRRFRVLLASLVSPALTVFCRCPMALGSLLVFLRGGSVRFNHMHVFVH
jgi:hypothetical protein